MMFCYLKSLEEELWTVGFYRPNMDHVGPPIWVSIEDFGDEEDARRLVNYLHGGHGGLFPRK
jgi:hypothetical protein